MNNERNDLLDNLELERDKLIVENRYLQYGLIDAHRTIGELKKERDEFKLLYENKYDQHDHLMKNYWKLGREWCDVRRWAAAWKQAAKQEWRDVESLVDNRDELLAAIDGYNTYLEIKDRRIAELEDQLQQMERNANELLQHGRILQPNEPGSVKFKTYPISDDMAADDLLSDKPSKPQTWWEEFGHPGNTTGVVKDILADAAADIRYHTQDTPSGKLNRGDTVTITDEQGNVRARFTAPSDSTLGSIVEEIDGESFDLWVKRNA